MNKIHWRSLTATLNSMSEAEVKRLLDDEMASHKRAIIAKRLHQRYCALRTARERAEIMSRVS